MNAPAETVALLDQHVAPQPAPEAFTGLPAFMGPVIGQAYADLLAPNNHLVDTVVTDENGEEWRIVRTVTDERGRVSADARRVVDNSLDALVFYPGSGLDGRWVTYTYHAARTV